VKIERVGHKYTVVPHNSGKYRVVMILSEHDNLNDAINAMLEALNKEGDEIMNREIEELRKQGVRAVSFKEAIKDMTHEQRKRFLEERNRKFINPLLDMNIEMLEHKRRRLKIKRVK
jgi:malonyl CoA-acyl carrier protein transacylase